MILNIAGIMVDLILSGFPEDISIQVKRRYRKFEIKKKSGLLYNVALTVIENKKFSGKITVVSTKEGWKINGRGIKGMITENTAEGRVFPDIHIIDSFLRMIYSYKLVSDGGFLMHAAGIGGRIYTGPEGSGKTTSVKGKKNMLGDDIIALKKEKKQWYIQSTPFTGEFEGEVNARKELLKEFFILSSVKEKLKPEELYRKLLRNVVFFSSEKDRIEKIMKYCEEMAFGFPGYGFKNKHEYKNQ